MSTVSAASLRLEGYLQAIKAAGLSAPPEYQIVAEEWHLRDGATGMVRLLGLADPPDAVFCFNDTLAFGALHTLGIRGLNAPRDIAVIGFDNVPMAEFSVPPLTTIEPGTDQIAKQAVDLLAARVDGRNDPPADLATDCSLIVRRSA